MKYKQETGYMKTEFYKLIHCNYTTSFCISQQSITIWLMQYKRITTKFMYPYIYSFIIIIKQWEYQIQYKPKKKLTFYITFYSILFFFFFFFFFFFWFSTTNKTQFYKEIINKKIKFKLMTVTKIYIQIEYANCRLQTDYPPVKDLSILHTFKFWK